MSNKAPLSLINGDRAPNAKRGGTRRSLKDDEQVICFRCENDIGVATSAVVKIVQCPRRTPAGRKRGGRGVWACAHCLTRGVITELMVD